MESGNQEMKAGYPCQISEFIPTKKNWLSDFFLLNTQHTNKNWISIIETTTKLLFSEYDFSMVN